MIPRDDWHSTRRHVPPPGGCDCAAGWDADAARMGMSCASSEPMPLERRPYIPTGVDAQGRQPSGCRAFTHAELTRWPWEDLSRPGPLSEAELDAHNREKLPWWRRALAWLRGW